MENEEIYRYIRVGKSRSICVDRCLMEQYPGIVRNIIIKDNAKLQIDFLDKHNLEIDEGEFSLYFYYDNYETLFSAISEYIKTDMKEWNNYTRTAWYPPLDGYDLNQSWSLLKSDFINKTLYLPAYYKDFVIPGLYWKGLASGKLKINYTDEELKEYFISTLDDYDTEDEED